MPDFRVIDHGSVATIEALSDEAKVFADENFAVPGWSGVPTRFVTDHRPALLLMEQMLDWGFEVEGL